jgi:uncharacterized protein
MLLIPTRVGPSAIHGLGLFAVEFVPRGTPIWRFASGFDRECSPDELAGWPPPAQAHARWFGWVRPEDGHVILSGDHACFMNHSLTPNTGTPPDARAPVTTVALRDLAAGEEITCNYFAFDADAARKLGAS